MSSAQYNQETPNDWVACKDCGALRPVQTLRTEGCDECVTAAARKAAKPHKADWNDIRAERDARVRACDWVDGVSARSRIGAVMHDKWSEYRTLLFDITKNFSSPGEVKWPSPPDQKE